MKLNLGCGSTLSHMKGYLNCDILERDGIDKFVDITQLLPFDSNSIDEIQCNHVLEHILYDQVPNALVEFYRVLKPGAKAWLSLPKWEWVELLIKEGPADNKPNIMRPLYGHPYGEHRYIWGESEFTDLVKKIGFVTIKKNPDEKYKNDIAIIAMKGK